MTLAVAYQPPCHSLLTSFDRVPSAEIDIAEASKTVASKKTSRQRVRFNENVGVRTCLHVRDYTDQEYLNCFYRKKDYVGMKKDIEFTVRTMIAGRPLTSQQTFRGLESTCKENALHRRIVRAESVLSVLEEQNMQRKLGIEDHEAIRRVYSSPTVQACRGSAKIIGRRDELEARYLNNNTTESSKRKGLSGMFAKKLSNGKIKGERKSRKFRANIRRA